MATTAPKNIVSAPPLMTPISDKNGVITRVWSAWFRDMYNRTSNKAGNAIDAIEVDTTGLAELIAINTVDISDNKESADSHIGSSTAHGSNGNIVGKNDIGTEALYGLLKRMAVTSNAVTSTVSVISPDPVTAPATYNQAQIESLVVLANESKAAINQLTSDLNDTISVLNDLIAKSKTAGQMSGA